MQVERRYRFELLWRQRDKREVCKPPDENSAVCRVVIMRGKKQKILEPQERRRCRSRMQFFFLNAAVRGQLCMFPNRYVCACACVRACMRAHLCFMLFGHADSDDTRGICVSNTGVRARPFACSNAETQSPRDALHPLPH